MPTIPQPTADLFRRRMRRLADEAQASGGRVPMREIFALAKEMVDMPVEEIERLFDDADHDIRVGAVSIMDWQARRRTTGAEARRALFNLYVRRHDRIDNWDLVDRCAPSVVGGYLQDKSREPLYRLAHSDSQWERRTAIVATYHFIKRNELDDTFAIAEILVQDDADLVRKAVGGWIREAGKRDQARLLRFLDRYAGTMPRVMLRFALEHQSPETRRHYMQAIDERR
jgi:3-methyladenine DNA glycosylase AlkD